MEIIERYIYAVTQRLPEKQRADIKRELQSLIEDMLEERAPAGRPSREDAESVLLELGHPSALAAKYRGYDRYLIGPMMFEPYLTTLKIVFISIFIALTCVFAIKSIVSPFDILEHFTSYMVSLITAGAQGFGWVTIVFGLTDYFYHKDAVAGCDKNKGWKPSDLPQIPDTNTQIKKSEPIAGIIFTVLFTAICLYSIDLLGIWWIDDGERTVIPFLNSDVFRNYLPIIWIVAALGILKEIVKIVVRRRTSKMLAFHIVMSIASAALVCVLLADPAVWNSDFIRQLEAAGMLSAGEVYDTAVSIWTGVTDWLIIVIVFFTLFDIISETYKWYRAKTST